MNTQGLIFCFGVALVFSIASLPTDLYATFRLEARFGFNKTTWKLYLTDKLKGLLLGILIGLPLSFRCSLVDGGNRLLLVDLDVFLCFRIPTTDGDRLSHADRAAV